MAFFVSDATELSELKNAVQKGNAQECTAGTMTLLKLCKSGFDISQPDMNSCFVSYNHPQLSPWDQPVGRLRHSAAV